MSFRQRDFLFLLMPFWWFARTPDSSAGSTVQTGYGREVWPRDGLSVTIWARRQDRVTGWFIPVSRAI